MIELYLGRDTGGWAIDGELQDWRTHEDPVAALRDWTGQIASARGSRWRRAPVDLWLSGGLARPFICGPFEGLRNWTEAETVATAIAPDSTGLGVPCAVVLESWPENGALGVALDQALADAISSESRRVRIRWRNVRPRWALALNEALRDRPGLRLFALGESDALTILGGPAPSDGMTSFDEASSHVPLPAQADVQALWQRRLVARDLDADAALLVRMVTPDPGNAPTSGVWPTTTSSAIGESP